MDKRIKVRCNECGRKWTTASLTPQCSRCNSVDIEPANEFMAMASRKADKQ